MEYKVFFFFDQGEKKKYFFGAIRIKTKISNFNFQRLLT